MTTSVPHIGGKMVHYFEVTRAKILFPIAKIDSDSATYHPDATH